MKPPFLAEHQLNADLDGDAHRQAPSYLPGYPYVSLGDRCGMLRFLEQEFCSKELEQISDKLWWMSKLDSANISPLHRQIVKGRRIIITEDPKLHLVWINDRIFIKPLPRYLTSYAVWRDYLGVDANAIVCSHSKTIRKAALGYLRTYYYLVRSESDFYVAQEPGLHLVPTNVTWEQYCEFMRQLGKISDWEVSGRYAYGEIRMTRLNFYAPVLLGKSYFQRVEYQYKDYFAVFYGPVLFVAGVMSILLSGLQVAVAVQGVDSTRSSQTLLAGALWCSVTMTLSFAAIFLLLFAIFVYKVAKEWDYAIRNRLQYLKNEKRRLQSHTGEA
jgi:hypothetical protein